MQPLLERLAEGPPLLADGAMGTMLVARGLRPGECPESLSLTRPELLEEIARSYFEAGAELLEANTFGASPLKLAAYHLAPQMTEINRRAVRAVRNVVDDRAYVAACVGPSGRLLKPYGDADPVEVSESYRAQMRCLIDAGVDAICIETMTDLHEAQIAAQAAKEASPVIPVTATMTFDPTPRGFFTIMGVTIPQAAEGLRRAGADLVGSNCGNGIENMVRIAAEFRGCTAAPLIIQPNAGLPRMKAGQPTYPESPAFMAEHARALLRLGVAVIGGCCGTTPAHIRALRSMLASPG
jgi:5-methyltetrahydrofolate--homocysteine methyltransferase